jgi:hypothetical protein
MDDEFREAIIDMFTEHIEIAVYNGGTIKLECNSNLNLNVKFTNKTQYGKFKLFTSEDCKVYLLTKKIHTFNEAMKFTEEELKTEPIYKGRFLYILHQI